MPVILVNFPCQAGDITARGDQHRGPRVRPVAVADHQPDRSGICHVSFPLGGRERRFRAEVLVVVTRGRNKVSVQSRARDDVADEHARQPALAAEPHPPVTQLDPSIPAAFEVILSKALAKKPEDRYQRAGEMANDLRNLRSLKPPSAAPAPADDEKTMVLARDSRT